MLTASNISSKAWVGSPVPRKEDEALLTGQARFIDDLSPVAGIRFVAILRSPHAHARMSRIEVSRAMALPGVLRRRDRRGGRRTDRPVPSVVKRASHYYPIAIDRVRYVGEPVAVVVADSRYIAEDACDLIEVEYEAAAGRAATSQRRWRRTPPCFTIRPARTSINRRSFRYGDPERAFAEADRVFDLSYSYPRYASTPMETFGVIAHFEHAPDRFTVWSNFQGPFVLQPLMAGALRVPGNRLRLITPTEQRRQFRHQAGGALLYRAARRGKPQELVCRSNGSKTGPSISRLLLPRAIAAARSPRRSSNDGKLIGLRFENVANMGAYIRPPEPASLYRMHAASNGCYDVRQHRDRQRTGRHQSHAGRAQSRLWRPAILFCARAHHGDRRARA